MVMGFSVKQKLYALPHVTLLPVASREMLPAEVDCLTRTPKFKPRSTW